MTWETYETLLWNGRWNDLECWDDDAYWSDGLAWVEV
jgi:hypothetical protein